MNPRSRDSGLKESSKDKSFHLPKMTQEEHFFSICVPPFFKDVSLEACDKIKPALIEFGYEWAKKPTSLLLCGGLGNGKSTYAFSLIRQVFRKCPYHLWPKYFTSPDLDSKLLNASKSLEGDSVIIKELGEEDLLFIDDLGRETRTDRLKRQFFELFNYRYTHNKPTIVTSNYTLEQIGEVVNDAIASRMQEWQIIEFKGPDLRGKKIIEG